MVEKICCIIGKKTLTKEELKKTKNFLLTALEHLIENNCNHFIIGTTTETDILAAELIASLKDKNPNVVLELAVQNEAMICLAPNEIKLLFFKNKIDLVHIEQKEHNYAEEKECYKCTIDRSDVVVIICNENINIDIDEKLTYTNNQNKRIVTIIV